VEKEYVKWLHDIHIPMLLESKQLKGAAIYKLIPEAKSPEYYEYMLVFEFDNQEGCEAYQSSPERAAAVAESETHDWRGGHTVQQKVQYKLVKSWER